MNSNQDQILVQRNVGQVRDICIQICQSFQKPQLGARVKETPSIMSHVEIHNQQTSTRVTSHNFTKNSDCKLLGEFQSKIRCVKITVKAARDIIASASLHLTKSIRSMMIMGQLRKELLIHHINRDAKLKKITKTLSKESKIELSISLKNNKSIKIKQRELTKKPSAKIRLSFKNLTSFAKRFKIREIAIKSFNSETMSSEKKKKKIRHKS